MANYYYNDSNGNKLGPYNEQALKSLITQGIITPTTPLETEGGHTGLAGQIPGLFDSSSKDDTPDVFAAVFGIFDISFTRFFENIYIPLLWVIILIFQFCGALSTIYWAFYANQTAGMVSLIIVPLFTIILLLSSRMALEYLKITFRIELNTRETRDLLREIKEQLEKQ